MKTLVVFYDGWCPLCRASAQKIRRLDWFHAIELLSFREKATLDRFGLQLEDQPFEQRIVSVRLSDHTCFRGIHTFLQIAYRAPLLWTIVPLLQISIWIGIGGRVYDWVANRRTIIPTGSCTEDQCSIHAIKEHKSTIKKE
jgi:predicted DCC family thiol-disulfide oxidoreductase YuxK